MKTTLKILSTLSMGVMFALNANSATQVADDLDKLSDRITKKITTANKSYEEIKDELDYEPVLYSNDDSVGSRDTGSGLTASGSSFTPTSTSVSSDVQTANCDSPQYTSLCDQLADAWQSAIDAGNLDEEDAQLYIITKIYSNTISSRNSLTTSRAKTEAKSYFGFTPTTLSKGVGGLCSSADMNKGFYSNGNVYSTGNNNKTYYLNWVAYECRAL